ncbi:MAG: DUF2142 domain-containing protein [Cytophagaceae bacterium]|nr:DUF2142 domain-containing protein [Cytophagaceae bacterium]
MIFLQRLMSTLAPDRFFMVCALLFGLIFIVITPPFQTPDEINHFYRSYQVSEGTFIAVSKDHRVGGELPASLVSCSKPFCFLRRKEYTTTSWSTIIEQVNISLNKKEIIFIDFPNTGMYSFVSYMPQAIGIFIFRSLDLPPIFIFYGGRLSALLFWVFSMVWAIRLLPFYKWLFTLLALLPMSVATNMSLSADVMTNVLAFLVIAYSLHLAYSRPLVSGKQMTIFSVLGVLLALAKVVYLPLILLILLVPQNKFRSKSSYYGQLLTVFVISGVTALCWSAIMKSLYVPSKLYNPVAMADPMLLWTSIVPCASMTDQMQFILSQDWWYVPYVFVHSLKVAFEMYSQSYIGTFGWLDTYLPVWFICVGYLVIFLVAFWDGKEEKTGRGFKPLLLVSFSMALALILFSQLLTWVCVGEESIDIIQGRYLIPIFPLLFMLLHNTKWTRAKQATYIVVIFSLLSLSYSSYVIFERYFVKDEVEAIITLSCNAEEVVDISFLTDTATVLLDNANTKSNEQSRSGKYSAKISLKNI